MNDCVFCKIVAKEIPALVVYDDDKIMAFLDVNPRFEGHTIIIPKQHAETLTDLDDETAAHLFVVVKKVAEDIKEKLGVEAFNLGNNNGEQAGQVVKHLHIHIIPRPEDPERKYGFEAAFPVSEEAKAKLQETYGKIGTIDPVDFSASPQPQQKPQEQKEEPKEERDEWYFDNDDDDEEEE